MMLDERYRLFRICAQTCHFTQAAELAYRTQSAVSQSMARLESELGVLLFHREGKRLKLTEAGQILLEYCDETADRSQSLETELANLRGLLSGRVRLAASSTTACYWLPGPLAEFRGGYPGIRLKLLNGPTEQIVRWLAEGEADLGLVTLPVDDPRIALTPLLVREDVLIAAPGSRHLLRRPPRLQDLQGVPFVQPDPSIRTRGFLDTVFARAGVAPEVVLEIRGLEVVKRYVGKDFGVSIVPRMAVEAEIARGELEAWPLFAPEDFRTVALAVPVRRTASLAAMALFRTFAASAGQESTEPEPGHGSASRNLGGTLDRES